jgi:two-component system phosphate regulon sensor histidine kinase PhoR
LNGRAADKSIELVKEEPLRPEITFRGDRGRILQVLTNLVHNAIIYNNPYGYVKVTITELENTIQFDIADNGIGIPQEDLPRIFERFYRVSKDRSTASGGTGLGLSIVRNILENMGGTIEVDSEYGKGTNFTVYIPKMVLIEDDNLDEEDEDV